MKYILLLGTAITLFFTAACQDDAPEAGKKTAMEQLRAPGPAQSPLLRPEDEGVTPSDYNQGQENVSMTTKKQNQGNDNARVKSIARDLGFSPRYVTFGGRHAYVFTTAADSWDKQERIEKQQELKQQYKQELPRYQVHVKVLNS